MKFSIKVPTQGAGFLCSGVYAKTGFNEQSEQKRDANNVPLWSVRVLNGAEPFNVTIAADEQPAINQNELITFENLEVNISKKGDTKLVWFTCDSVKKAGE